MSMLRAPNRLALRTVSALAGLAVIASSAAAQEPAPLTIASEICEYASDKPAELQAEIEDVMLDLGFTGLPAKDCDKFVQAIVKSCLQLVKAVSRCSVDIQSTAGLDAGKMSEYGCEAEPDKDDQKACKSAVKANTQENVAIASQSVQQSGFYRCNFPFAEDMRELCLEGVPPPP